MHRSPRAPWIVLAQTTELRWGGDLRRHHIFRSLATRTGAATDPGSGRVALRRAIRRAAGPSWPWRRRPLIASGDLLTRDAVRLAGRQARPFVLDLHDHAVAQADALARPLPDADRAAQLAVISANLEAFPVYLAPSPSFARLIGLDPRRTLIAPNGTDPDRITPQVFPARPAIGFASGAAAGRGIETLIEAARLVRGSIGELRLHLWLAELDQVGHDYVEGLRAATAADDWIDIGSVAYAELGSALALATVLVVPHPANPYLDSAVPVKLMDAMAAGRPVVVTPRLETRRIVERCDAGLVAADDSAGAIAHDVRVLLEDGALARRLGDNGRRAAVREFAWDVIGARVADEVLVRAGQAGEGGR